ncbi:hypothetical protein DAPPUDRAFT_258058 [Daphnia pulex]|uniref:Uncharacterized protein n=1 Tax=Daphnia pulex TaxID=6669 RepID=E9HEQ9_DAPPU|nr:hypothetical protein DAPPUDRAFT_258058 [Daphnia pulex]|eukprot:EFX69797.1 hypothetical protein DAPPUDRAFT_258058 [Daphnia pulex]
MEDGGDDTTVELEISPQMEDREEDTTIELDQEEDDEDQDAGNSDDSLPEEEDWESIASDDSSDFGDIFHFSYDVSQDVERTSTPVETPILDDRRINRAAMNDRDAGPNAWWIDSVLEFDSDAEEYYHVEGHFVYPTKRIEPFAEYLPSNPTCSVSCSFRVSYNSANFTHHHPIVPASPSSPSPGLRVVLIIESRPPSTQPTALHPVPTTAYHPHLAPSTVAAH